MISDNTYWFIFRDMYKIPSYILDDIGLTICINRKYTLSEFRHHSPEPYYEGIFYYTKITNKDFYSIYKQEATIDDDSFIALVNPTDEMRTYLKLLGLRLMNVDHVPIQQIYDLDYNVVLSHKQSVRLTPP